ncbi:MAG: signal peptidase II [Deltaproteobacteria bacterium]|nr:signal peptidase II [Deltaproteobacteria bacterium]
MRRNYHMMIWPALVVILLDQISKLAVMHNLRAHESVPVIAGFFNLVHVRNRGMAFGFLNRPDISFGFYVLVGASLVAIVLLLIWFIKLKENDSLTILALSLILGGAVGNLIDRLRFREVVDFLDVYVGAYHWPAFNVADSAITVGAFLIAINIFFRHKNL